MAETTGISWANATLNFWIGCTKVGPACDHCYAETWGARFGVPWGVDQPRRRCLHTRAKALKLERLAVESGAPFYCFSNSLSDIFDKEVPIEWLAEAFANMWEAPSVTFLLLTKRASLIERRAKLAGGLPPNAAIGATVVTQEEADRDIPRLLAAKAALKPAFAFLSMEPLLGPVDIRWTALHPAPEMERVDWVITGGESGAKARPTHPEWLRAIRNQCATAGVPFHHKQNGEWMGMDQTPRPPGNHLLDAETASMMHVGKKHSGRLLDGVLHDAMPVR